MASRPLAPSTSTLSSPPPDHRGNTRRRAGKTTQRGARVRATERERVPYWLATHLSRLTPLHCFVLLAAAACCLCGSALPALAVHQPRR
ncbi:hypothetical protein GUJ93_ZPchr0010g9592 [Zizania palustris]|uniref:Uncharacterized protein n=1 Tax=Zizania palustris TaxID=103762 RepID=A0A8J5RD33_ZIZPA|nr:hypothetical protein GUJ93_ZPchr0130g6530 [Zizania palustris]KAG8086859.1 hypothetical protein GUJ93_ZPchr0010g9592 [Zizania palustris]